MSEGPSGREREKILYGEYAHGDTVSAEDRVELDEQEECQQSDDDSAGHNSKARGGEQNSEEHALIKAEIPPIAAGDVEILGVAVAVAELPFERNVVEFGI